MSRWFRFYDDAINDAKLLRLSDANFRAWVTLLCLASKHDGVLPSPADIALVLRVKQAKVAEWLAALVAAGLIDNRAGEFSPHNWNDRQYKSDSSAERMKRHRDKKRDVTGDVTVTVQNRAETEQITEQISEADASGADAPVDPPIDYRKRLFGEGLAALARISGKGPDACRSFVGKCLKAASDDAVTVLGLIEDAERNQTVNPTAWIVSRLQPTGNPNGRRTVHDAAKDLTRNLQRLAEFDEPAPGGVCLEESGTTLRLLPPR